VLCCHSNETRAPTAIPSNIQLGGHPYHSSKLHPGPCSSVGMRRGTYSHTHTHTQRDARGVTNFALSTTHAKCNYHRHLHQANNNNRLQYCAHLSQSARADFAFGCAILRCHLASQSGSGVRRFAMSQTPSLISYVKTRRHPQNRKYMSANDRATATSMYTENFVNLDMWFLIYASRQTDRPAETHIQTR